MKNALIAFCCLFLVTGALSASAATATDPVRSAEVIIAAAAKTPAKIHIVVTQAEIEAGVLDEIVARLGNLNINECSLETSVSVGVLTIKVTVTASTCAEAARMLVQGVKEVMAAF